MSTPIDDGGYAFPTIEHSRDPQNLGFGGYPGMTLRDYFAGQALVGLLTVCTRDDHPGESYLNYVSRLAYENADAMLRARKGGAQ